MMTSALPSSSRMTVTALATVGTKVPVATDRNSNPSHEANS